MEDMATHIEREILDLLGSDRIELLDRVLGVTSWFRCPVCGKTDDSAFGSDVRTVLYTDIEVLDADVWIARPGPTEKPWTLAKGAEPVLSGGG